MTGLAKPQDFLPAHVQAHAQDTRLLRLTTPLGRDLLQVECVRGEESISQGYAFEIAALSTDAALQLKTLIGQPALLELLTADGADPWRPFHGHITRAELNGANGGLARYTLVIEPWTAFLALGRDSRIFQDLTVFDILDAVFGAYQGQGKLMPAWRIDVLDRSIYTKRSIATQYQESDLAFAQRLMHEEGLFYFFEHVGDAASPGLGSHAMVIADHNGSFKANVQATIDFAQPGAVMKVDSIDCWRSESRWQTNAIEIGSWDYRTLRQRTVGAAGSSSPTDTQLQSRDTPGAYAYASRAQGQRIVERQLQALEAARDIHVGAGTVRTLAPGTTFTLHGHPRFDQADGDDQRSFLIVRTVHLMHNNLGADMGVADALVASLPSLANWNEDSLLAPPTRPGQRRMYRNRIDAIRSNIAYRSSGVDGQGRLLHPRPSVEGQQSAIVVGPAGSVIHTDRDHRVKVQFHWQRGAGSHHLSHNRLNHPHPEGASGAPGDDRAGTWVRVATPVAGANWGTNLLPRVGQEVLIDFFEGNIDRPVVIGSLYNGQGGEDAQHNQVAQGAGTATGNAPAWFPGAAGAHFHPAALSGFKTQAMAASASGAGAYSQLVFDDSPGQSRLALQRHAKAHEGAAELNLGQLRHQVDNQRLQAAGFGAELKTDNSAALRAGQGMLMATDMQAGSVLDSRQAQTQIEQSHQMQVAMATTAHKHNAVLKDEQGQAGPEPEQLPAIAQMAHSIDVLKGTASGSGNGTGTGNSAQAGAPGGQGQVTAYTEAQLQLSSPAGIAATTPADAIFAAGNTSSISAGQDINFAAQRNALFAAKAGISLFTYGKADNADKPNQETGIRLHAASGKVSSQSQSDATCITADKAITLASISKSISIGAQDHILMTAQGAYLRLEGGNIDIHGPGKMEFLASMKELAGPASSASSLELPKGAIKGCEQASKDASATQAGSQTL